MEDWLKELRGKIVSLKSETYTFSNSNFEKTDFQMWFKTINNIFKDYEFNNELYKQQFSELNFKKKEFTGNLIGLSKPFFEKDLETTRNILTKIMLDIDTHGEKFMQEKNKQKEKIIYITRKAPMKCFLIDTPTCNKEISIHKDWVFQAYEYKDKNVERAIIEGINPILSSYNLIPKPAKDLIKRHDYMCKICQMIQESGFFIADFSNPNISVGIELGLALGIGKEVILMTNKNPDDISDLKRNELIIYNIEDISKLQLNFTLALQDLLKK